MVSLTVTLPIPHWATHPNRPAHWSAKSRHAAKQRGDAKIAALVAMREQQFTPTPTVLHRVVIKLFTRTAPRHDRDNLVAWMKHYFDGIADAGVVSNDRLFIPEAAEPQKDKADPRVEIVLIPEVPRV